MTDLSNLSDEIGNVLTPGVDHYLTAEDLANTSIAIATHFSDKLNAGSRPREHGKLWASDIGKPCVRQLYYEFTEPAAKEPLTTSAKIKFLYGNVIEEMIIALVRATGKYTISREQERYEHTTEVGWVVSGRADLMIDNIMVDVKSTSTFSYKDYTTNGVTLINDKWGYKEQVNFYAACEEIQQGKELDDRGILFVDKQLGHVSYVPVAKDKLILPRADLLTKYLDKILYDNTVPPRITMAEEAADPRGNVKLGTICSYCPFKKKCWPELRTFIYSRGPVYLTQIKNTPNVPEVQ